MIRETKKSRELDAQIKLIGIGGPQRAGKGETILELKALLGDGWVVGSTSELLIKEAAGLLSYWTSQPVDPSDIRKNKSLYRPLLQHVGDLLESQEPARIMKSVVFQASMEGAKGIILDSVRRASEVKYLSKERARFILVDASEEIRSARPGGVVAASHATETEGVEALRKHKNTYIIKNEQDKNHLYKECLRFVELYLNKYGNV